MKRHYIDIHCHPSLKPYSKSFKYDPIKQNDLDSGRKNSIWHYSPPNLLERSLNRLVTLTKFTQTDLTSLAKADTQIVIISLYPFEKHFLTKRIWGWKGLTDVLVNLVASISQKRIDFVRNHRDYFEDLTAEYDFYKQLNNQVQQINGKTYTYRLVNSIDQIENNKLQETPTRRIINIILSIEGGHAFNTGLDMDKDTGVSSQVLENVRKVKSWDNKPLFITFAHHFYNELCGHARSISIGLLKKNQDRGLGYGITTLGTEVIDLLLDHSNGNRILIDVKHMSVLSRKTYYQLLDTKYTTEDIPIIVSHGAVNGKRSLDQQEQTDYPERVKWLKNIDINIYDDEIIRIARSNGVFGLQLDERRIGSKKAIRRSKIYFPNKRKQLQKKSLLVWRQIEHIAEVLNEEGLFCWGIQCIGSDFDGIVDPINGLWTSENLNDLADELINHSEKYLHGNRNQLKEFNRITSETIIERVMHGNAYEFLQKNYH